MATPSTRPGTEQPKELVEKQLYAWGELERPTVDVVLVHGLNPFNTANAHIDTWKSETSSLPELLLEDFPSARILTASWKSAAFEDATGKIRWADQAMVIARDLISEGVGDMDRPVVFIGHSLGGLMLRQVLIEVKKRIGSAFEDRTKYAALLAHVRAIIYVATPFQGSKLAGLFTACWTSWKRFVVGKNSSMVGMVEVLGDPAAVVNDGYGIVEADLEGVNRIALYETEDTTVKMIKTFSARVVEYSSAIGGGTANNQPIGNSNHLTICKPSGPASPFYKQVKSAVEGVIRQVNEQKRALEVRPPASAAAANAAVNRAAATSAGSSRN